MGTRQERCTGEEVRQAVSALWLDLGTVLLVKVPTGGFEARRLIVELQMKNRSAGNEDAQFREKDNDSILAPWIREGNVIGRICLGVSAPRMQM